MRYAAAVSDDLADVDPDCSCRRALLARLQRQDQGNAALTARPQQVEEILGQHSDNSEKPPSFDSPAARDMRKKRPRSGQNDHRSSRPDLLPPEHVIRTVLLVPQTWRCCGERLSGTDERLRRQQVTVLPPIVPFVTEYQQHILRCGFCKATTTPSLLMMHYRLSEVETKELLSDVIGVVLSTGVISAVEARVTKAVKTSVLVAHADVKQDVTYIDETGWWEHNRRSWLWVSATSYVVVFVILKSRGKVVAKELLVEGPQLVVVADRYCAHKGRGTRIRQLCWAHLRRSFREMASARDPAIAAFGRHLGKHAHQLFVWWLRVKECTLKGSFRTYVWRLRSYERTLLALWAKNAHRYAGVCRELERTFEANWTYDRVVGVEPTNNDAERQVRARAVYWGISSRTAAAHARPLRRTHADGPRDPASPEPQGASDRAGQTPILVRPNQDPTPPTPNATSSINVPDTHC